LLGELIDRLQPGSVPCARTKEGSGHHQQQCAA